jgi:hypothetical protein
MLTNSQMVANRFGRWALARRKLAWITTQVNSGKTVYVATYTKITAIKAKHLPQVKATKTGLYIQHGRKWLNADYCKISAA